MSNNDPQRMKGSIRKAMVSVVVAAAIFQGSLMRAVAREAKSGAVDFQEILQVIRTNLAGVTEAELNEAMVDRLLAGLHPRVLLVGADGVAPAAGPTNLITRTAVYEQAFGYLRVGSVADGLAARLGEAWAGLAATNNLRGIVLDLRYADGTDYRAAAAAADRFLSREMPLLDWEDGSARSTAKPDALGLPMVVLVNGTTEAAAEALAGALRATDRVVVLGSRTAGHAWVYREVPLSTGQRLRLATRPIRVGDAEALPDGGLVPDVVIEVAEADEKAYFDDAFRVAPSAAAGRATAASTARRRMNEAELVRRRREEEEPVGARGGGATAARRGTGLLVQDPVLVRGLDLLKGIGLLERPHRR